MLFKKLIRTFFKYKAQFISMIIMVALGIGIFSGFNAEWYSISKNTDSFFEETNLADYRIYLTDQMALAYQGFTEEQANKVKEIDGIIDVSRVVEISTTEARESDTIKLAVSTNTNVTGLQIIDGADYDMESVDGLWISEKYSSKNNYRIGDEITLSYGSLINKTFTIQGICLSGEYLINIDGISVMPNYETMGYAFISPVAYKEALHGIDFYSQINVKSDIESINFSEEVDKALGNTFKVLSKEDLPSYSEAHGEMDEGKTMGLFLPIIFLVIALLTMVTTMERITKNEKVQIGILKALGFKNRKIIWHYTSYALFVGLFGLIIGIPIGYALVGMIISPTGAMGTYMEMPSWDIHMPGFVWLGSLGSIAFLTLIGFLSVKKVLKGNAAEALKPYSPKKMKSLWIEKFDFFHKLSFSTRWNLRDSFRHLARTFVTIFGVFGCVLLLFATFGMKSTFDLFIDLNYNVALNYNSKIALSDSITNDKAKDLANKYNGDYSDTIAIKLEGKTYALEVFESGNDKYVILDGAGKKITNIKDNGVYVCSRMMEEYRLSEGDSISFSIFGENAIYKAKVIGKVTSNTEGIFMTKNYADSIGLEYQIDCIYTDTLKENVESDPAVTSILTKKEIMDTFDAFTETLNLFIIMLVVASSILAFVVLFNLGTMSYMERYRELSTLKVLGFKNKKINIILISQTLVLTLIGILIGVPTGYSILIVLLKLLASNYEMTVYCAWYTYAISIVITFFISFMVSYIISRKTKKIDMVESLKAE